MLSAVKHLPLYFFRGILSVQAGKTQSHKKRLLSLVWILLRHVDDKSDDVATRTQGNRGAAPG